MKKIIFVAVGLVMSLSLCFAQSRENILKVYNWADYIDEELIGEFEQWYEAQTGKPVKIVYQLFDINEIMLSKIERGHEDFDVVCPSDYIIERMLRADLLLPIDKNFPDSINWMGNLSPYIVEQFNKVDGHGKNANDYAVGYMWGTTGYLYNTKYVTEEEVSTWNALANPKFAGKIFVKDAFRDVYCPILIYLKQDELKSGAVTLDSLMYDSSDASIALVEQYLKSVSGNISGWEADFGKEQMTKEKAWLNFTWSGDAAWAMEEAEAVGVSLDYRVPDEGSNVWFDGWVIPKYAKNVEAARYFIDFMCKPENAIRNMAAIGYVSAVGGQQVLESQIDAESFEPLDASYFFGPDAAAVPVNPVLYPDYSTIHRCAMMHDSGDRTDLLLAMWSRVKGDNASATTYIILAVAVLALIAALLVSRKNSKKRKARRGR